MLRGDKTHVHILMMTGEGVRGEGCKRRMERETDEGVGIVLVTDPHTNNNMNTVCY